MIKDYASLDRKKRKSHIKDIQSTCYWIDRDGRKSNAAGTSAVPVFKKSTAAGSSCDVDGFKKRLSETVNNIFDDLVLNELSDIYLKHVRSSPENIPEKVQSIILDVVKYFHDVSLEYGGVNMKENADVGAAGNKSENVHEHTQTADIGHSCHDGYPEFEGHEIGGNSGPFAATDGNFTNNDELERHDGISEGCGSDTLIVSSHDDDCYEEIGSHCSTKVVDETLRCKDIGNIVGSQQSNDSVATRTRSRRASLGQSPLCPFDNPEAIKRINKRKKIGKSGGTADSPVTLDDEVLCAQSSPVVENKSIPSNSVVEDGTNECEVNKSSFNEHCDQDNSIRHEYDDALKSGGNEEERAKVAGCGTVGSPSLNHLLNSRNCESESYHGSKGVDSSSNILRSSLKKTSSNGRFNPMHSVNKPNWKANMTFEESMSLWDDYGPSFRLLEELDDLGNYIPDPKRRRPVGLPCDGKKIYSDDGLDGLNSKSDSKVSNSDEAGSQNIGPNKKCGSEPLAETVHIDEVVDVHDTVGGNYDDDCFILGDRVCEKSTSGFRDDARNKDNVDENSVSSNKTSASTHDSCVDALPLAIQYHSGEIVVLDSDPVTPKEVAKTRTGSMCTPGDLLYADHKMKMRRVYDPNFEFDSTSAKKHPPLKLRKRRIIKANSYFQNFQTNECKVMWPVSTEHHLRYETAVYYSEHRRYSKEIVIDYNCGVTVNFATFGKSLTRRNWVHPFVMNAFCFKLFHERPPKKSSEHFFFSTVGDYFLGKWDDKKDRVEKKDKVLYNLRRANSLSSLYQAANLYFPILHENHWSLFIVAVRDGYFCFLDPLYDEGDVYQKKLRQQLIPNFVKAWDETIEESYPFDQFVIHYPKIPKQDIQDRYYCGNDSGILVMKYIELWDPYVNLLTKFTAHHVSNMRLLFVSEMVFSRFNLFELGKIMIGDHQRMVQEKEEDGRSK
ncbi:hypothetical protein ACP70R_033097 [Stipagrostis hirtigluma subsp. patula]